MKEWKLSENEFKQIYSEAVVNFNSKAKEYKETPNGFLTKCLINSFLSFLGSKDLISKGGKIYAKE